VLTKNEKLTAALMIEDGFIAHRFTPRRESELVKLDAQGRPLEKWSLPTASLVTDLSQYQQQVVFVLSGIEGSRIYQLNLASGEVTEIMPIEQGTVRAPLLTEHWLVYTSDVTGIDQLYAMSLSTAKHYQISTRPYGSYFPLWDSAQQRLIFSDYTSAGQQLVSVPFTDGTEPESGWQPIEAITPASPLIAPLIDDTLPDTDIKTPYAVAPYSPTAHLWNPHSWWLALDNNGVSASVLSNDVLSKLGTQVTVGYGDDAYYSIVSASYRLDAGPYLSPKLGVATDGAMLASFDVTQPWQWQDGVWHRNLSLSAGVGWEKDDDTLVYGKGEFTQYKEGALQSISVKTGWQQSLYLDQNDDQEQRLLATTGFLFSPTARTSLAAQGQVQSLEGDESLVETSAVVSDLSSEGWGLRYQLAARWNNGAVGKALGTVAFWRNTTYGLHWLGQEDDVSSERAVGVSVAPELNLFRNRDLIVSPMLAYYYRLDNESNRIAFSLIIAGD
jgi:hypothetical protein